MNAPPNPQPNGDLERLWTPWRMPYVGGGTRQQHCIFCDHLAASNDVASLILHRGQRAFAVMNLYPYNTGHLMLVPNEHVASPEQAEPEVLAEIATLKGPLLRALRRVFNCAGFNLGTNVGAVAGAGIADHLHEHVVPRWQGDANFMPILASTMVLPELIPVTYAKIRAEMTREMNGGSRLTCVVLADNDRHVLVETTNQGYLLPVAEAAPNDPLWRAAVQTIHEITNAHATIAGWGGLPDTRRTSLALTLRVSESAGDLLPSAYQWIPVENVPTSANSADHQIATALTNLRLYRAED